MGFGGWARLVSARVRVAGAGCRSALIVGVVGIWFVRGSFISCILADKRALLSRAYSVVNELFNLVHSLTIMCERPVHPGCSVPDTYLTSPYLAPAYLGLPYLALPCLTLPCLYVGVGVGCVWGGAGSIHTICIRRCTGMGARGRAIVVPCILMRTPILSGNRTLYYSRTPLFFRANVPCITHRKPYFRRALLPPEWHEEEPYCRIHVIKE